MVPPSELDRELRTYDEGIADARPPGRLMMY